MNLSPQLTKQAKEEVRSVTALIDRVHDDGTLPMTNVSHKISRGSQGTYYRGTGEIGIRKEGAVHPEMTLAHEVGHWIDDKALPGHGFSSENSPALAAWRKAVQESEAVQRLKTAPEYQENKRYLRYALQGRELWARSYAQYVATRSGDVKMLEQVTQVRAGKVAFLKDSQWSAADFAPIAREMDNVFKEIGWL